MFSMGNGAGGFRDRIGIGRYAVYGCARGSSGDVGVGVEKAFFSEFDLELEGRILHGGWWVVDAVDEGVVRRSGDSRLGEVAWRQQVETRGGDVCICSSTAILEYVEKRCEGRLLQKGRATTLVSK